MIREAIAQVVAGGTLSEAEAAAAMEEIMSGTATPSQLGAFLTALRLKGETVDEVAGLARVMRAKALHVPLPANLKAVDTCGTGGDGAGTFNVSTAAGFVVAAAGQPVAKHGNRAATSRCGSADVLEALGVKLELGPEQVAHCVTGVGFGFMFAPAYHPAMRHVGPTRREIGIRTVFNILGPLTNPAGASYQVLGVADKALVRLMGEALLKLGCQRALVVHGADGVDEISLSAPTQVCEVRGDTGDLLDYTITPETFGMTTHAGAEVRGGDAAQNAALLRAVLAGQQTGAPADMVALNAGAALFITGHAATLGEGAKQAQSLLASGRALRTLDALVATTRQLTGAAV
ncbi:MAG TPA: anthranilate phosphoribosyltransferase [Ktedonobacterales bacterium]|jgi:anthranilate phosphoribosyltransferase|nr:anthranilate phosphoribosyltransferase [Ktedonobacterales bacterium]